MALMGHPILDLLGVAVAGAGAWYGYKRVSGQQAAPPVAPVHPQIPVAPPGSGVPAGTATPAQAAALAAANTAVTTGNASMAQAAIDAATSLGLYASSDLGQAAGGGADMNSSANVAPGASDQALSDATSSDSSVSDDISSLF